MSTTTWDDLFGTPQIKAFGRGKGKFDDADHPRDRMGRFIETGSEVRLLGGALATVVAKADGDKITVRRNDNGNLYNVDKGSLTVTKRPNGAAPTDRDEDQPLAIESDPGVIALNNATVVDGDGSEPPAAPAQAVAAPQAPEVVAPAGELTPEVLAAGILPADNPELVAAATRLARASSSMDLLKASGDVRKAGGDDGGNAADVAFLVGYTSATRRFGADPAVAASAAADYITRREAGDPSLPTNAIGKFVAVDGTMVRGRSLGNMSSDLPTPAGQDAPFTVERVVPTWVNRTPGEAGYGWVRLEGTDKLDRSVYVEVPTDAKLEVRDPDRPSVGEIRAAETRLGPEETARILEGNDISSATTDQVRALVDADRAAVDADRDARDREDYPPSDDRDLRFLRFRDVDEVREHLHGEATARPDERERLDALADDPTLSLGLGGSVVFVKDGKEWRFYQARTGRPLPIPEGLVKNKRTANGVAGDLGGGIGVAELDQLPDGQPDFDAAIEAYGRVLARTGKPGDVSKLAVAEEMAAGRAPDAGVPDPVPTPDPVVPDPAPVPDPVAPAPAGAALLDARAATTGTPVTFGYARNTTPAPQTGGFGQDVEPAGRYLSARQTGDTFDTLPGYETGTVTMQSPLVLEFGGDYGTDENWKNQLSARYGGLTGRELSQAVRDDGYDGIITRDKYGPSEIVDLSSFTPAATPDPAPGGNAEDDDLPAFDPEDPTSGGTRLMALADRARDGGDTARADLIDGYFSAPTTYESRDGRYVAYSRDDNGTGRPAGGYVVLDAETGDEVTTPPLRDDELIEDRLDAIADGTAPTGGDAPDPEPLPDPVPSPPVRPPLDPTPDRAPDGSSDPMPEWDLANPGAWGDTTGDGAIVMRREGGTGEADDNATLTATVTADGVVGSRGNVWRWEVSGGLDRRSGVALDRAVAMQNADQAIASIRKDRADADADRENRRAAPVPDSFDSPESAGVWATGKVGLPPGEAPYLAGYLASRDRSMDDRPARVAARVDGFGLPGTRTEQLLHTIGAARGPEGFDGQRAADAMRRFEERDPTLPLNSVGTTVTVRVPAGLGLGPDNRPVSLYRDVTGEVVFAGSSADGTTSLQVLPDDGPPVSVRVPTDAKLRAAEDPADLPGTEPGLPDDVPTLETIRAGEARVGDRIAVDGDAFVVTGSRFDDETGRLVLSYTGDDGAEWDYELDERDEVSRVLGGTTPPADPLPDPTPAPFVAPTPGRDFFTASRLSPGDRFRTYQGIHTVVRVEPNPDDPEGPVLLTSEHNGVRETGPIGRDVVLDRVLTSELPTPDPLPRGAGSRPALYGYQRQRLVALGLDEADGALGTAASRIRTRQALSAEESRVLADRVRAIAADADRPVTRRSLERLAAALDASSIETRNRGAAAPANPTGGRVEAGTLRDVTEGDQIAFVDLNGNTAGGLLTAVRSKMGGRLYEVTVTDPNGNETTHLLNRDTTTYRLPDLPEGVVVGNPPPTRRGPVVEHVVPGRLNAGDRIEFRDRENGGMTDGEVIVLRDRAVVAGGQVIVRDASGRQRTVQVSSVDGGPTVRRTGRSTASADQPWDNVFPDENPQEVEDGDVEVGDRIRTERGLVGTVARVNMVNAGMGGLDNVIVGSWLLRLDDGNYEDVARLGANPANSSILAKGGDDVAARAAELADRRDTNARVNIMAFDVDRYLANSLLTLTSDAQAYGGDPARTFAYLRNRRLATRDSFATRDAAKALADRLDPEMGTESRDRIADLLAEQANQQNDRIVRSVDEATPLAGETAEQAVLRVLNAWGDRPPAELGSYDNRAIIRTLVGSLDGLRLAEVQGRASARTVPEMPEGTPLAERIAAYKAALPAGELFDKIAVLRPSYGKLDPAALARGEVPEIVTGQDVGKDQARDGGPGAATMANLDLVMAAGRDLRVELERRVAARMEGKTIGPVPTVRQLNDKMREINGLYSAQLREIRELQGEVARNAGFRSYSEMYSMTYSPRATPEERERAARGISLAESVARDGGPSKAAHAAAQAEWAEMMDQRKANGPIAGQARRDAALELLREIRPTGGVKLTYESVVKRQKRPLSDRSKLVQAMRFAEQPYPDEWLAREDGRQNLVLKSTKRGYYKNRGREIALSPGGAEIAPAGAGDSGSTATHELGHAMEYSVPGLRAAERAFLWSRTSTGEIGSRERERKQMISMGEYGYKDEFPEHYTGREYPNVGTEDEAWEVFTTGVESVFAGSPYADDSLTEFILGTMSTL